MMVKKKGHVGLPPVLRDLLPHKCSRTNVSGRLSNCREYRGDLNKDLELIQHQRSAHTHELYWFTNPTIQRPDHDKPTGYLSWDIEDNGMAEYKAVSTPMDAKNRLLQRGPDGEAVPGGITLYQ